MSKIQLIAKLTLFTFGLFWIMIFLYAAIVNFDFFRALMADPRYGGVDVNSWFMTVLEVWYGLSCVVAGAIAARKSFSFVVTAERVEEEASDDESKS